MDPNEPSRSEDKSNPVAHWAGVGLILGAGLDITLHLNGAGIGLGMVLGAAWGSLLKKRANNDAGH